MFLLFLAPLLLFVSPAVPAVSCAADGPVVDEISSLLLMLFHGIPAVVGFTAVVGVTAFHGDPTSVLLCCSTKIKHLRQLDYYYLTHNFSCYRTIGISITGPFI
jgi:hypothetical protein